MHPITETLMVGNIYDAKNLPPFVRALLLVADEQTVTPPPAIPYAKIPLKEFSEAEPRLLRQAVDWLERQSEHGPVLVCCRAGMGRSVSAVIAYLCCVERMPYTRAVQLVTARRPGACPLPNLEWSVETVKLLRASGPRGPQSEAHPSS
ncbi:dual specificity protein phosphatase family protein [Candidatus Nitrospira bockiana]